MSDESKAFVDKMKKEHKEHITQKSDGSKSCMFIYNGRYNADYCFARMFRRVREQSHTLNSFLYIMYFDRSSKIFDYNSLHKELNKMFGKYFRIVRYYSGKKNVRILSFELKKKPTHWKLWFMALYLACCMLRLTDSLFMNQWQKQLQRNGRKKPINNWKDLIYLFHRYVYSTNTGYELNNNMVNLASYSRAGKGGEKELKEFVDNYLATIYAVYGKDFSVTKKMISNLAEWQIDYQYQTPIYNKIKRLKELGK